MIPGDHGTPCRVFKQPKISKRNPKRFWELFRGAFLIQDGAQDRREELQERFMLSPSWAVLCDLGFKLGCLGRCWEQDGAKEAARSVKMSRQRLPDGKAAAGGW